MTFSPSKTAKATLVGLVLLALALLRTACMAEPPPPPPPPVLTLHDILPITNQRRYENIMPDPTAPWVQETLDNSHRIIPQRHLREERLPDGSLTHAAAIRDIEYFFTMLQGIYARYAYLGGDAVFFPVRDAILEQLAALETITRENMARILIETMTPVVNNNHFVIDFVQLVTSAYFFENGSAVFGRTENGFYNTANNLYVTAIEGHELYDVFRLSLDRNGSFFYSPVVVLDYRPANYAITIIYEDGTTEAITLRELQELGRTRTRYSGMGSTHIDDIPLVYLTVNVPTGAADSSRFIRYADALRGEPVVILDLRGNRGGGGTLPGNWLYRLTGVRIPSNIFYIADGRISSFDLFRNDPRTATEGFVHSDKIVIILINRRVASAGEIFVDYALNLENTLIIGQNTSGSLVTPSGLSRTLPNSEIEVIVPNAKIILPHVFVEGVGYAPDVWVHGGVDALDAALAMLRHAGFNCRGD